MNPVHDTNWVPGIAVLAGSLLLAMMYLLFSKKGVSQPEPKSSQVDLEERYRALLGQLKEHATSKHLLTPEAWAAEQQRLEHAAAAVLKQRAGAAPASGGADLEQAQASHRDWQRKISEHAALKGTMPENVWQAMQQALQLGLNSSSTELGRAKHEALKREARSEKKKQAQQSPSDAGSVFSRHPMLTGSLAGGGAVLFFTILGLLLATESKPREQGRGMTGADPNAKAGAPGPMAPMGEDPRMASLRARIERAPDDVEALAEAAGEYMKHQQFDEAFPLVTQASTIDPFHVKTRIYRTVLEAVGGGSGDLAMNELIHVADTYEGAYEARLYAGSLGLELQKTDAAIAQFDRYLAEAPLSEQPPMVRKSVEMLKAQIAAGQAPKAP